MNLSSKMISQLSNKCRSHWPLITTLIVLLAFVLIILVISLHLNHGTFTYALDDAYIHLAIAKNYMLYGVWGVTKYQFSSSASSLLWPLLLDSTFIFTGVNNLVPLILNIVLSSVAVALVYHILRFYKIPPIHNFMALLAVTVFAPLPYLIFIGMEHILQIILAVSFVFISMKVLIHDNYCRLNYCLLILLGVFLSMVRYESLLLIFIISFLFLLKKKFNYSISLVIFSLIPIVVYGIFSVGNGWYFLPNSLVIKSTLLNNLTYISFHQLTNEYYSSLFSNFNHLLIFITAIISSILVLTLAVFRYKETSNLWEAPTLWLSIGGILVLIHLFFINNDWPLRYTAYIVVIELIGLTIGLYEYLPKNLSLKFDRNRIPRYMGFAILIILLLAPFAIKTYELTITPQATNNIYEQQYQMAMFLGNYYQDDAIAANDIGAINYYADIKCLDLVGLSSADIAQIHVNDTFNAQTVNDLANQHQVKIAIIYEDWWHGNIPSNWIKVGEWTTPNSVILGGSTISFYATTPQNAAELIKNLRLFSSKLPKNIKQAGIYTLNTT